jgi:hypothetical protein
MHIGILRRWGDGLGSGRLIAQGTGRANLVGGAPPAFDEHVGFPTRLEDLAIEPFGSQLAVETLDIASFPRTSRFDEQRLDTHPSEPFSDRLGRTLRSVLGPEGLRCPMMNAQRGQPMQDVIRSQPPFDIDGQTFPSVLIPNGQ